MAISHLKLREFDCTEALGAYGESARIEHWLESRGGDEVFRNGALVVCYIENGDTPTSLAQHLATLLGRLHSRVRAANDASKPLVLPVLCPRPPNNLDDGDSITSGSQVDQVHELTRQFDLRQAEREWSAVIADTLISLRQRHSVQKLHADFAPGLALTGVIAFEQLLSSASAWFDHNVAWAAQVAVPLDAARIASTPSKLPRTPAWLAKTAAWLKVTAPVISAPSTLDTEMQITLWEEHQLPPATSSVKSLRHLRSVGRYTLGAIFLGVLWAFLSTFPALESLMRFQGSPALISSRPACVHLNSFPTMTHSGFSSPFHYSWPTHPPRELATVPANRSSDLALYHYFDLATLSSRELPPQADRDVKSWRQLDAHERLICLLRTQPTGFQFL